MNKVSNTRDTILYAVETVVMRDGVARLTLESVAQEARISKGGLLYHFPTKEALIQAMIERLINQVDAEIGAHIQADAGAGRWTRAYVRATFEPQLPYPGQPEFATSPKVNAGLIAAVATNPQLLEPLRARFHAWQKELEQDGIDPVLATIVRLATDGLWACKLLGFWLPEGESQRRVLERLLEFTKTSDREV